MMKREKDYEQARIRMVDFLRSNYKIRNERILNAMLKVRRHMFIPESERVGIDPYGDYPCPVGQGQTISQPYIVAYMTELLDLQPGEKVLEVGTGSGYQAAVLAELGVEVFSVEILKELAKKAGEVLAGEGYKNVHLFRGDGNKGWPEYAPYDAVIVTCGPESIPDELVRQMAEGGRLVIPVGHVVQSLVLLKKKDGKIIRKDDILVRFVPMIPGDPKL